ncbi:MAG: aminodeoxychorismate synthase component I [Acidiferrobacterales bacterium]
MLRTVEKEAVLEFPVSGNPDLLALHQLDPQRYPYLLQSTRAGGELGRYDILFAFPGEQVVQSTSSIAPFLQQLDSEYQSQANPDLLASNEMPFRGGWFLFLSYELAGEIENLPPVKSELALPIAMATRIPAAVVRDHGNNKSWIVIEQENSDADAMHKAIQADLKNLGAGHFNDLVVDAFSEEPPQQYLDAINTAKHYIREGDIFQANLSREWRATFAGGVSADNLYARLRRSNPAPFAGLVRVDEDTSIVSSSPERLVNVDAGHIRTRPIAGTYPRGADKESDEQLASELLAHPKERSEHIMLIDLERNDLGRICRAGTVTVPELMVLETYQHVHHIVSEVVGELRTGVTPGQVIAATFPGGTITGCPKVRCMEIIAELESGPRGAYTGSIGYLNRDGSMDLNILIRSITLRGNEARFRAGAGIVADSVPQRELDETRAKAEGLIRALR